MKPPNQIEATRSTLLVRLKDLKDQRAWQEFFDVYWTFLFNFARRAGLNEADAEEIVMETVETVARKIEEFEYNRQTGRFKGWLLTIVRFKLGDHFRKHKRRMERGEGTPFDDLDEQRVMETAPSDLEKLWETEWQKRMVDMALERVKQLVGPKQYQIFHCYVIQEQDASEVADFLDVSLSQVYVAKNRVGKIFESELKLLAQEER